MSLSHKFEIEVNSLDMQGEIDLASGHDPDVTTTDGLDDKLSEIQYVHDFFAFIIDLHSKCGCVRKLSVEINE